MYNDLFSMLAFTPILVAGIFLIGFKIEAKAMLWLLLFLLV